MTLTTRPASGSSGLRAATGGSLRDGGAYYPPDSVALDNILVAELISHDEVLVSFNKARVPVHPTAGAWLELTLTKNPLGVPVTNLDGLMLSRYDTTAVTGWQSYRDSPIAPGTWAHYGLFAKYSFGGSLEWVLVDSAEVLLPVPFSYQQRLFNLLPMWYQEADDQTADHLVQHLFDALGFEVDITRTWVETLGHIWDPAKIPSRLLRYMSEVMGAPYESSVGDPRVRKLMANLVYLRKIKGTKESIEGYLTALSGYRILAHQSPNIISSVDAGEFREGTGGWSAGANTVLSRLSIVAGNAPPPPQGVLHIERTGSTGAAAATLGGTTNTARIHIADGTGRQLAVSFNARTTASSFNATVGLNFYDLDGGFISTVSSVGLGTTTTFGRKLTAWLSVPNNAEYVTITITTGSIAAAVALEIGQIMLVDIRYRPEGMPGSTNVVPFSTAGSATYSGVDFYDSPRSVWLNVYPQRTNFAVNSDFTLNNLPAGGWSVMDAATYGAMPFAYATYTAVASGEVDYADIPKGFNSITPTWTVTFDTSNSRLALNSSPGAPWVGQVRSMAWPVRPGLAYSAGVEMSSSIAGSKAMLRIQWMTINNSLNPLLDANGIPMVTQGPSYNLVVGTNVRVEIRNAIAPPGAGYGRLVVESLGTAQHVSYMQRALIEDTAVPGGYFNGGVKDGAPGDFGYTGTTRQTPSVYYMNYKAILGSGSNRLLTASKEMLPLHVNEPRIISAYQGLYTELA